MGRQPFAPGPVATLAACCPLAGLNAAAVGRDSPAIGGLGSTSAVSVLAWRCTPEDNGEGI